MGIEEGMTSRSELPEYFSNWIPSSAIGSTWTYSHINFGLLEYVLESSTHENINQLYKSRLLHPLHMRWMNGKNVAQGYTEEDIRTQSINNNLFPSADVMKVSGDDMKHFLKACLQLPGVPVKIINAMRITQTAYVKTEKLSQGLGWSIYSIDDIKIKDLLNTKLNAAYDSAKAKPVDINNQKFDANVLIEKIGETGGFSSYIVVIPVRKSGVVVLVNRYIARDEIIKIGRDILFNI